MNSIIFSLINYNKMGWEEPPQQVGYVADDAIQRWERGCRSLHEYTYGFKNFTKPSAVLREARKD